MEHENAMTNSSVPSFVGSATNCSSCLFTFHLCQSGWIYSAFPQYEPFESNEAPISRLLTVEIVENTHESNGGIWYSSHISYVHPNEELVRVALEQFTPPFLVREHSTFNLTSKN
ncbi:hypothetical protein BH10CYA1_BH10CYA1_48520 [soil metagenome]